MRERDSRAATVERVRTVLAADCACSETTFLEDRLVITAAETRIGQRRFPRPHKPLLMVTMGRGVVVTTHPDRMAWLSALLRDRGRDDIFAAECIAMLAPAIAPDGQQLHGPTVNYVCTRESLRSPVVPHEIAVTLFEGEAVRDLYQYAGFSHALSYRPDHSRPDVLATVAQYAGTVIGIAAASADCETLWQIGVDVVPAARDAGIGRALVSRLTEAVIHAGRVPYYSAAISNVRSLAVASGLGYWPLWSQLYARDHEFTGIT